MRQTQSIVRPNLRLGCSLGAVMRYHTTANRTTAAIYIGELVYDDLKKRYPELMKNIPKSEIFIPAK